jgi:FkbM family methyltransferase
MKSTRSIKALIPKPMLPLARTIYKRVFGVKVVDLSGQLNAMKGLGGLKCTIAWNELGIYCLPLSSHHRPSAQKILRHRVHEPETLAFMAENCGACDIVHAGTYFGDFLPALSRAIAPGAKVWAFEPNPENYVCARITVEINALSNVVLTHAGLGEKPEKLLIKTQENGKVLGGASEIVLNQNENMVVEPVQMATIDDAVGDNRIVSIIQLDVEGHEKEALCGAMKTIRRCRPVIILEVLPGSTLLQSEWFHREILAMGYSMSGPVAGNVYLTPKAQA